jgi:hypothetical protein
MGMRRRVSCITACLALGTTCLRTTHSFAFITSVSHARPQCCIRLLHAESMTPPPAPALHHLRSSLGAQHGEVNAFQELPISGPRLDGGSAMRDQQGQGRRTGDL